MGTDDEAEKPPSRFRFTRLTWTNAASAKIFGLGEDYQGTEDSVYAMELNLNLRYYFVDTWTDFAYVNAALGASVELTNSDTTTLLHQPMLKDTSLSVGYGRTVYRSASHGTWTAPGLSTTFVLPTSYVSQDQGKYLSLGLNGVIMQSVELAGMKSSWLSDILVIGSVGYSHQFSRGYVPTYPLLAERPRLGPDGSEYLSDQITMSSFATDMARLNLTYYLSLYKGLSLANTWDVALPVKHQFPGGRLNLATGAMVYGPSAMASNVITTFDVALSYLFSDVVRLDLGYMNVTPVLLDTSAQWQSLFYSTDAVFYGNVVLYFDGLADKLWPGPQEKTPMAQGGGALLGL